MDGDFPQEYLKVHICNQETGKAATQKTKYRLSQAFIAGTEPQEIAKNSPQSKKLKEENTEFFKEDF